MYEDYSFLDEDKLRSVNWARKLINGEYGEWVVLDTETTGLWSWNQPIEIGVISKYGSEIFNSRVKPNTSIERGAINVHGITESDLVNAPSFSDIYPELKRILENKLVIIYNDSFDKKTLFNAIKANKLPRIKFHTHCAMKEYARYYGDWHDYYGNYTWKKIPGVVHSAIGDAKATHKLIKMMAAYEPEKLEIACKMFPPVQLSIDWEEIFNLGIFTTRESGSYYWECPKFNIAIRIPRLRVLTLVEGNDEITKINFKYWLRDKLKYKAIKSIITPTKSR